MLKSLFLFLVFLHGLIHLLGFIKAFGFAEIKELSLPISKVMGMIWLTAFLLFLATVILFVLKSNYWRILAIVAVLVSQILIVSFWQDAKFGTIANVIILLVVIVGSGTWRFENTFQKDVKNGLLQSDPLKSELISKNNLQHFP